MCSLDYRSMYYNFSILLRVWVKFVQISFHDEFIAYFPYFLLPCSYGLDHCSYGLSAKERKRFCVTMLWLRPVFTLSWCSFPM
jgi:hypothetical protein